MTSLLHQRLTTIIETGQRLGQSPAILASIIETRLREESHEDFAWIDRLLGKGDFARKAKLRFPQMMFRHIQLLHLLLEREFISNEGLKSVFPDVSQKSIHNWMHYVRRFTRADIKNTYGIGYSMKLEDRKRLKQEIENVRV